MTILVSEVISAKTGINYPDLEPGNKFWNRVRVPGFCYKSLIATQQQQQSRDITCNHSSTTGILKPLSHCLRNTTTVLFRHVASHNLGVKGILERKDQIWEGAAKHIVK